MLVEPLLSRHHAKNATHSDLGEMLAWQFLLVAPSGLARQTCSGTLSPLLVAPMNVARQGGPRHRPRGAGPARPASVAASSRQQKWRDKGYLSRQYTWHDQTGYGTQIKL